MPLSPAIAGAAQVVHRPTGDLRSADGPIELMANAANINLVAFSQYGDHPWGQALALFAIALTVADPAAAGASL